MNDSAWLVLGVALTAPPAVAFPVYYAVTAPWWKTYIGRAIFIQAIGLALLVLNSLMRLVVGQNSESFQVVRLAVYIVLPFGMWYVLWAYAKTRRLARENRPEYVTMPPESEQMCSRDS